MNWSSALHIFDFISLSLHQIPNLIDHKQVAARWKYKHVQPVMSKFTRHFEEKGGVWGWGQNLPLSKRRGIPGLVSSLSQGHTGTNNHTWTHHSIYHACFWVVGGSWQNIQTPHNNVPSPWCWIHCASSHVAYNAHTLFCMREVFWPCLLNTSFQCRKCDERMPSLCLLQEIYSFQEIASSVNSMNFPANLGFALRCKMFQKPPSL